MKIVIILLIFVFCNCALLFGQNEIPNRKSSLNALKIKASPNPFLDSMFLTVNSVKAKPFCLMLLDAKGIVVKSQSGYLKEGNNIISVEGVNGILPGTYFYHLISDSLSGSGKILKL